MLKAVYEPQHIDIFHKVSAELTEPIAAGTFVMKDADDAELVEVSDGTAVWGVLSQNVHLNPGSKFALPYNNFEAYPGDFVGIYTTGYFKTDQFVEATYEPGEALFVTNAGKLTNDEAAPSATEGNLKVGYVVSATEEELFYRLAL